jgi:hypothetical protein
MQITYQLSVTTVIQPPATSKLVNHQFLDAFAKLSKASISFVTSVCLSVCPSHGKTRLPLDGFSWVRVKVNFTLEQATKAKRGSVYYPFWPSLTSALDGVSSQRHAPAPLPPGKTNTDLIKYAATPPNQRCILTDYFNNYNFSKLK